MMLVIATYLTPKAEQPDGSVLVIFAWTLQREEVDGANERSVTHQGLSRNLIEFCSKIQSLNDVLLTKKSESRKNK